MDDSARASAHLPPAIAAAHYPYPRSHNQHHISQNLPPRVANTAVPPPGKRVETEEERRQRKKREYERSKADERHKDKRASQPLASGRPVALNGTREVRLEKKPTSTVDKTENRLKRSSTFVCKIRFRNELPDPVSQPKLMRINDDKDQYTKYTITSLEKNFKHKLLVEPDLGIPLDLLDLSAYNAPLSRLPMDPADAELLRDDEVIKTKEPESIRKKDRPTDKGVAWLVKTQYISPLSLDPAKQSLTEKQAKELKELKEGRRLPELNERDPQIHNIEESFRVSKLPPIHGTKPELEPVEVLPLLPAFDRWSDQFVHMIFDTDPTGESEMHSKLDQLTVDELESRAIVKSFSIPGTDNSKPEKFVAYMVPKVEELSRDMYNGEDDIEYQWVREYHWDLRTDDAQSSYVFCFDEDAVHYVPLGTKLIMHKKKAKEGRSKDDIEREFPIPSRVSVQRRDPTEEELIHRDLIRQSFIEGQTTTAEDKKTWSKRRRSPEPMTTPVKQKIGQTAVHKRYHRTDEDDDLSA